MGIVTGKDSTGSDLFLFRLRCLHCSQPGLHHSDRKNDGLEPGELEAPLDSKRRLVVKNFVDEAVLLENERPQEEDRPGIRAADLLTELDDLVDGLRTGLVT